MGGVFRISLDFGEKENILFLPVYLDGQRLDGILRTCLRWTEECQGLKEIFPTFTFGYVLKSSLRLESI